MIARLRAIDAAEAAVRAREEARNILEGYLYRMRDLLQEDGETPFRRCSKEAERQAMREKLEETFAWMHDHADDATTAELRERKAALEYVLAGNDHLSDADVHVTRKLENPVTHRYTEVQEFPIALNNSQKWNWSTRLFLTDAHAKLDEELASGEVGKYTKEELAALEKTLKEHEVWLNDVVEKQKLVTTCDDPAVESKELYARSKVLETHLQKLVRKKAPKKKSTSTSSAKTASETKTESATQETTAPSPSPHDEL